MSDAVTLILPTDLPEAIVAELQGDLEKIDGVRETEMSTTRVIDLAALMMLVQFTAGALGVVDAATNLFLKIRDHVRAKGVKGIMIELPNGVRISLDSASPQEIGQVVSAWKAEE